MVAKISNQEFEKTYPCVSVLILLVVIFAVFLWLTFIFIFSYAFVHHFHFIFFIVANGVIHSENGTEIQRKFKPIGHTGFLN